MCAQGINGSIESEPPFNEHFYGLVNVSQPQSFQCSISLDTIYLNRFFLKFGNTCYVNSVLQALYFCKPFRDKTIEYKIAYNQRISSKDLNLSSTANSNETTNASSSSSSLNDPPNSSMNTSSIISSMNKNAPVSILKQEHLLNCLAELFYSIVTMKKKKGIVQPKKFIARLRKDNGKLISFLGINNFVFFRKYIFILMLKRCLRQLVTTGRPRISKLFVKHLR